MQKFPAINDNCILSVPVKDNQEKLVDLLNSPEIFVDQSRAYSQNISRSISFVRKSVAQKLLLAQKLLPRDIKLKVIEGYRPLDVQKVLFQAQMAKLHKKYPTLGKQEIYQKAAIFVAPPKDVPPHSTGGTVDLTLMEEGGTELDLGFDLKSDYSEACLTDYPHLSPLAQKNRKILVTAMTNAGFVNYPVEWWHWSYGDKYWAYTLKKDSAVYGSIENYEQ